MKTLIAIFVVVVVFGLINCNFFKFLFKEIVFYLFRFQAMKAVVEEV